jgi:four helix bundle protein
LDNKQFGKELEKRTRLFGVRIIRRVVRTQLTKCGTSIGANYREANRARSNADFRNKIKICETETSETQYWLEVIIDIVWLTIEEIKTEYNECRELLAIFTSAHSKSL